MTETSHAAERVLIVEDDPATRSGLTELVRAWGFTAEAAADGAEALEKVTAFRPSIVVTDLVMPRMSGIELLKALQPEIENIKVILLTAQGTVDTAVEAVKAGAEDYLTKPLDPNKLQRLLERLAEINQQKRENQALRRQLNDRGRFGRIIGNSPAMRALYQVLEQAAPTPASMLILGESGTGKELVAQTIHQLSPRARGAVCRDQLRGDSRHAARERDLRPREGRVHRRHRSARRLLRARRSRHAVPRRDRRDDAGDAGQAAARPAGAQVPPARRPHRAGSGRARAGGDQHRSGERRSATASCARISYYRLNVFTISLPPLRERKDDLPLLIQAFIDEFNTRDHRTVKGVSPAGDAPARTLRVAGQRARAAQRHRARDHPRARRL